MEIAVIIDIVLIAVLLLFTVLGWRRGAFKSLIGIVVVIVAVVGAGFVSKQVTPLAVERITPLVSQQIELRFDNYLEAEQSDQLPADQSEAEGLFGALGLYRNTAEKLADDVMMQVQQTGKEMLQAAAEELIRAVVGAILFIVSFVILLIALKLLSKILGLLTAVPGLHLIDALGGGIFGLAQGALILFALVWAIQFFGTGVPEQIVEKTILFRFFATLNPVSMVIGL